MDAGSHSIGVQKPKQSVGKFQLICRPLHWHGAGSLALSITSAYPPRLNGSFRSNTDARWVNITARSGLVFPPSLQVTPRSSNCCNAIQNSSGAKRMREDVVSSQSLTFTSEEKKKRSSTTILCTHIYNFAWPPPSILITNLPKCL